MSYVAVAAQASSSTAGTTLAATFSKSVAAGRLLVATCGSEYGTANSSTVSATDTKGNTWVVVGHNYISTTLKTHMLYCVVTNALTTSDTVTFTDTTTRNSKMCSIEEFDDVLTASPLDKLTYGAAATVTALSTTATGSLAQTTELCVTSLCTGYNKTPTATAPWTRLTEVNQATGTARSCHLSYREVTDGASQTYAGTMASSTYAAITATFKVSTATSTANAGADQTGVEPWTTITLTGAGVEGAPTVWEWEYVSGTNGVATPSLTGAATSTCTLTAPPILTTGTTLTLRLRVTIGGIVSAWDTITVAVLPATDGLKTAGGLTPIRIYRKT